MDKYDLAHRFQFHPADKATAQEHQIIRQHCHLLAGILNENLPEGREKSLAITKLEEVMMWSNAAIARAGRLPNAPDPALVNEVPNI